MIDYCENFKPTKGIVFAACMNGNLCRIYQLSDGGMSCGVASRYCGTLSQSMGWDPARLPSPLLNLHDIVVFLHTNTQFCPGIVLYVDL